MTTRSHIAMLLAAVAAMGSIPTPPAAVAALVRITFSGTYDTFGRTIFGESGSAVPYCYELTYDTALDTDPTHFATGAYLGPGRYAEHEMYAYSRSGVTTPLFLFGTKAWAFPPGFSPTYVADHPAALWLDTDVALTPPSRVALAVVDAEALLVVGGYGIAGTGAYSLLQSSSFISVTGAPDAVSDDMLIATTIVPEPATFELGIVAAGGFSAFLWWRRRSR